MTDLTVYGLRHPDGRWLYHLPHPDEFRSRSVATATADGQPMTLLRGSWWSTDDEATNITITAKPQHRTVRWVLRDQTALSVRYPAELSPEDFSDRSDREKSLYELYSSVTEEQPAPTYTFDGPFLVLQGREPPGPGELSWKADLPHELGTREEYRHLFPGQIPGLRAHLYEVIKAKRGIRYCFDGYQGRVGLHVVVEVPFDKPQTRWIADTNRRTGKPLKSGRTVAATVTRNLDLPVPAAVSAENYETALVEWERQVEFWLGIVDSATVAACSTCNGTGHVPHGAEKYSTR